MAGGGHGCGFVGDGDDFLQLHIFYPIKLKFGGESPLTMHAGCNAFRYCPDPLGIVTAQLFAKLEFGGQCPLTMRARCGSFRYCPNPLGIVTAKQLGKSDLYNPHLD